MAQWNNSSGFQGNNEHNPFGRETAVVKPSTALFALVPALRPDATQPLGTGSLAPHSRWRFGLPSG
jgi:hypothetical protein